MCIRDSYHTYLGFPQVCINSGKIIEDIIAFFDQLVNLVQNYDNDLLSGINCFLKLREDLISRPPSHRNFFFEMSGKICKESVLRIDNFTINIHNRAKK